MVKSEKYSVPAIDHAVKILEYLRKEHTEWKTLSDISEAVELNPSTCFRILRALQKYNIVSESQKRYKLGMYLQLLGSVADFTFDLKRIQQYLEKAALLTGQTSMLSQRFSDDRVIYIAKQESQNAFRINVSIGQQRPITCTSAGKCFLAFADPEEVEAIIGMTGGLVKYTEHTIVDKQRFMEELGRIREQGFSIGSQEFVLGVTGVAVPVFDSNRVARFVLSVSCFSAQVNDQILREYAQILKEIADQISRTFDANSEE
jgi:DNA-binding IclR family transcriptional regulator